MIIAWFTEGGLGLPDRDFYFSEDKKEVREKYMKHISAMFVLMGHSEGSAELMADTVFDIEKDIAEATMTKVAKRNPENIRKRH